MTCVLDYIKRYSIDELCRQFYIKASYHPSLPLVVLCYNDFKSPRSSDIALACRGLVVDIEKYSIVCSGMKRFFFLNVPINDFEISIKQDGTMLHLFYYYDQWFLTTKYDFADEEINETMTYKELFYSLVPEGFTDNLDKQLIYCFEMCSIHNRVIIKYCDPVLYFLCAFKDGVEVDVEIELSKPLKIKLKTFEDARMLLNEYYMVNPLFEGFIVKKDNVQYRMKSELYLIIQKLKYRNYRTLTPKIAKIIFEKYREHIDIILDVLKGRFYEKFKIRFDYYCEIKDFNFLDPFLNHIHGKNYCKNQEKIEDSGIASVKPYKENDKWVIHCYCGKLMKLIKTKVDFIFEKRCCKSIIDFLIYPSELLLWICDCGLIHQAHQRTINNVIRGDPTGVPCSYVCKNLRLKVHQFLKSQEQIQKYLIKSKEDSHVSLLNSFECALLITKII